MNLAVFTPYRHSEVTAAALRLADLGLSSAMSVSLAAPGRIERGVHPYWDKRVLTTKGSNPYLWAKGCEHIVWFDCQENMLEKIKLVTNKKTRHWCIPIWHSLDRRLAANLWLYPNRVCPSKHISNIVNKKVFDGEDMSTWCHWDSGLNAVSRSGVVKKGFVRIYVHMDSSTIDEVGSLVLASVRDSLDSFENSEFTLDCDKSWPKQTRALLKDMQLRYGARLSICYRSGLIRQSILLHEHDWALLPSPRVSSGIIASRALSCGTPVICFDIPPYNEMLTNGKNAMFIDCDLGLNWLGATVALPSAFRISHTMAVLFADEKILKKVQMADWNLAHSSVAFAKFWQTLWEVSLD